MGVIPSRPLRRTGCSRGIWLSTAGCFLRVKRTRPKTDAGESNGWRVGSLIEHTFMNRKIKILSLILLSVLAALALYKGGKKINPNLKLTVGQKLDSLNGVYVYYNGGIGNVEERNLSHDGYNLGLKYQCVEFVKRYYYEHYQHKMPDTYGKAKDFFDPLIKDGEVNPKRNLLQFTNPGTSRPQKGDLMIFDGHAGNKYGHVAIVSELGDQYIEIIQQNPGPFAPSRDKITMSFHNNTFIIEHKRLLGWLRPKKFIDIQYDE
jgi:hypothetical protein